MDKKLKNKLAKQARWEDPRYGKLKGEKEAVYQYLVDHAVPAGNGALKATVYLHGRHDFEWRVKARQRGVYRNDPEELLKSAGVFEKEYFSWKVQQAHQRLVDRRLSAIDKDGKWFERVILFLYRKTRDYIYRVYPNPPEDAAEKHEHAVHVLERKAHSYKGRESEQRKHVRRSTSILLRPSLGRPPRPKDSPLVAHKA